MWIPPGREQRVNRVGGGSDAVVIESEMAGRFLHGARKVRVAYTSTGVMVVAPPSRARELERVLQAAEAR